MPLSAAIHGSNTSRVFVATRAEALRAQAISLAVHVLLASLLVLPVFKHFVDNPPQGGDVRGWGKIIFADPFSSKASEKKPRGGGSGGEENPVPATKGKPAPFSAIQFTPPMPPRNPNPRLTALATVLGPPEIKVPDIPNMNFGLPKAPAFTDSAGPGHRAGYGEGCCAGMGPDGNGRGVGPGDDSGYGGERGQRGGRVATQPECAYCPNPAYSDEARKAKIQGSVVLRLVVAPDGRGTNVSVVKGLGLGLDEKAIEAVRNWRFKPARDVAGNHTASWVTIEVVFRLL